MISRTLPTTALFLVLCALAGCSPQGSGPKITFIGMATGSLLSTLESIQFSDNFKTTDRDLVGVVEVSEPSDGSRIVATWFSPDDRERPMGQSDVVLASGATVVRFSFGNRGDWDAAPYMLDVHVNDGERTTSSGSLHFFIGMDRESAAQYAIEYGEWKAQQQEAIDAASRLEEHERDLLRQATELLQSNRVSLALKPYDVPAPGWRGYVFIDTQYLDPYQQKPGAMLPLTAHVNGIAILDASGAVLLAKRADDDAFIAEDGQHLLSPTPNQPFQLTVLPTGSMNVTWQRDNASCSGDLSFNAGAWEPRSETCND